LAAPPSPFASRKRDIDPWNFSIENLTEVLILMGSINKKDEMSVEIALELDVRDAYQSASFLL
jgi:hypothetical protein